MGVRIQRIARCSRAWHRLNMRQLSSRNSSLLCLAVLGAALGLMTAGCTETAPPAETPSVDTQTVSDGAKDPSGAPTDEGAAKAPENAEVGKLAPNFILRDLDGQTVSLASLKGKTVVLEWFNPQCPFVKASHTKGSLIDAAKRATSGGVVWLSINSSGEGRQGFGVDANRDGAKNLGVVNPILLDPDGKVGHAYGATNTPHIFVIDPKGTLVYAGAVDNSPDGSGESPEGGKLVSYVDQALGDVAAGRPVAISRTKAYGCGVKYGG